MIELDEQLQRLADEVELPTTTPEDDLARGRARRRRRNLGAAGASLTTAAVIGTCVVLLSGGGGHSGASPEFAGGPASPGAGDQLSGPAALAEVEQRSASQDEALGRHQALQPPAGQVKRALAGYRDVLREDLDPGGARIQSGRITNEQTGSDSLGTSSLGTKLSWKGGGMLQIAVGRSLEGVQFFCDNACTPGSVAGASKAFVLASPGRISVAVFQDDGDIVALTADTSFGNNGTSTSSLGLTVDQLLTAAADPRLDLPDQTGQSAGDVGTQ